MPPVKRPDPRLVLVTGPPRCGTTMLAGLLSHAPAYPYLPECAVITDLIRERLRSERDQHPLKFEAFIGNSGEADRLYREMIRKVLRRVTKSYQETRRYLVLKDPYLLYYVDVLSRVMPWTTRTVCIVRDPRAAVSSMIDVRRRAGSPIAVSAAVEFLKPFYEAILQIVNQDKAKRPFLLVKYEDIVMGKQASIIALEMYINYKVDVNAHRGLPLERMDLASPWHTSLYEAPVTPARVSAFAGSLRQGQIDEVQNAFSALLHAFGYEAT